MVTDASWVHWRQLTLSAWQTNTNTCANSVDSDEMASNEPSHLDLHCLPFYFLFLTETLFASVDKSKFKNGRIHFRLGVVGCGEDFGYLTSPAILVACKCRGRMFLFLLFLHFHSCFFFFPVPFFHLLYYLSCLFSPFLWEMTQNDPQGLTCR